MRLILLLIRVRNSNIPINSFVLVTRRTVGARPRAASALPQRLPIVRHASRDGQRQSTVLADVAVPAGG